MSRAISSALPRGDPAGAGLARRASRPLGGRPSGEGLRKVVTFGWWASLHRGARRLYLLLGRAGMGRGGQLFALAATRSSDTEANRRWTFTGARAEAVVHARGACCSCSTSPSHHRRGSVVGAVSAGWRGWRCGGGDRGDGEPFHRARPLVSAPD
ncbi:hypothetical protein [Nonomuraea dietziae]|uniref:hypothetical protein n=1 Tax=Nonomuraea dietziae TaxID=65515 RepID=UPI0031CEEC36